jgi:uncharacterized protein (TIGR03792 family)
MPWRCCNSFDTDLSRRANQCLFDPEFVFYPSDPLPVLQHHPYDPHHLQKSTCLWRRLGSGLLSFLLGALVMILVFPGRLEAAPPPLVVVEQLRLKVPSAALTAWLDAERGSWEPWLAQQPGFMQRQLFWDPQRQEGTLLIYWASRQQWQATSSEEQQQVQQRFELLARAGTGQEQGNPFPLIFSGELLPQ